MQTYFKRGETDFLLIAVKFNDAYIYTYFWKLYSACSMLYTVQGKEMPFEMQIWNFIVLPQMLESWKLKLKALVYNFMITSLNDDKW